MEQLDFTDLKTIIEINSWTGNKKGVDKSGQTMTKWLKPLGFNVEIFHREKVGNHLLFSTPSQNNAPKLLLLGHLDTVFPPGIFESFHEDDEWVYGPGTCDMKGGNFVALCALRNLHQTHGQIRNIDVLLVSDEETGSDDSKFVTRQIAHHYDACIDFEAAGPNHEVVVGRKGVATYQIELTGVAAHAGNNYHLGKNANLAAAKLLIALDGLTHVEHGTTVNVGKIKGGISTNTISPGAELMVEARFTQPGEQERVLSAIPELIHQHGVEGVTAKIEGGLQRDVMTPTAEQQILLDTFANILGYPLETEQRGGVSDANIIAGAGVPTLDGFGPFGDGDHTEHERASKASFQRRIKEVTAILQYYSQV
ncbi:M20 family metallopeptidase [Photobacterium sp. ZSDE20]|uniref:M20 family metallopeptidase n=1 Tax=Photobacterium pectinilyticum TaxID=2906793 RepID=A0ABT1N489_9GAMM|nr:M20 family metallopeptidase [Photobacterium sp. ZSDE20]MCQ1059542.1 M20 family metallopeptidase [Photobacterium sp. ZSDE20]MDD1825405.1 M20 family metallopeptidase [Photobacterium sp. ZSDE20]